MNMKKFRLHHFAWSLILISCCTPLSGVAQEERGVVQTPQLRNILLEEFTGLHCSYCPSGHANAQALHNVLGHRMQTIAVHVGSLAVPSGDEVDLRSAYGEDWYQRQGGTGMPTGAVNRHHFEGLSPENSYGLSWGSWQEAARRAMNDTAQVNLFVESAYDTTSRQLSARVELYYPTMVSDSLYTLTVALTENYIRGNQTGGNAGDQYLHKHVLRDLFTDVWGDTLEKPLAKTVIEKTYTLEVPVQYNNRVPNPAHFEVIAFVSNSEGEILNSTSGKVQYEGRYASPAAEISVPGLTKYYSRTAIPVQVENLGTDTLRSIQLNVSWGDTVYQPEVADLSIPYGETQEVYFPLGEYPFSQVLKYRINTLSVNGYPYESRAINDYISKPCEVSEGPVKITLTTDTYGSDVTWTLRNRAGEVLLSGGPYADGEVQEETIEWTPETGVVYSFEIEDAFLDGFLGGYTIIDAEGNTVASSSSIGQYGDKVSFVVPDATANEEMVDACQEEASIWLEKNPVTAGEEVSIRFIGFVPGNIVVELFNLNGNLVQRDLISSQSLWRLNTSGMASGFYFIKATHGGSFAATKLLVR